MTKPIDLKPCPVPKCGGYAERGHSAFGYFVKCAHCGLRTEYWPRQCEATADWHRKCAAITAKPPKKPPKRPHRQSSPHHGGRREWPWKYKAPRLSEMSDV